MRSDGSGLDFEQRDTPVMRAAIEMLEKATDAARSALEKLKLDPMTVNAISTRNEAIKDALAKQVGKDEFTMPTALGATLRLGLALEREQVEKLVKGQIALEIEPNDNQERLEHIKRVDQIASGQDVSGLSGGQGSAVAPRSRSIERVRARPARYGLRVQCSSHWSRIEESHLKTKAATRDRYQDRFRAAHSQ